MNVIVIGTSFFGNPVSDYYKALSKVFSENGYRVVFIFDGMNKDLPISEKNISYYKWPSSRPTNIKDFLFAYRILGLYKPILTISNFGSHNVLTLLGFIFKVKNRIDYIHTITKARNYSTEGNVKSVYKKIRKKQIYKLNTHIFTNSEGTKKDASQEFNIPQVKISVFPLLLGSSNIKYLPKELRDNTLIIVGGLNLNKGHHQLLLQFSNCISKYPDLKLKIIGTGIQRDTLLERAKELGIENNVHFMGKLKYNEVCIEFSKALIGISSSHFEAYGLVNIEALREGTPIICTKTSGSIDIINEHQNGMFLEIDKNNSLLESVETILASWEKFSYNALESFKKNFSIENKLKTHYDRINSLIEV